MAERRSWLESTHLHRNPRGRSALERLATLDAQTRNAILDDCDRLAELSVSLAHGYFVAAVAAADAGCLAEWNGYARRFLECSGGRSLAQAFFEFNPLVFLASPRISRDAWADATLNIHSESRRLAVAYAESCGSLLCRTSNMSPQTLSAWAEAIVATMQSQQWRGEFLAGRLIDSAAVLMAELSPPAVALWASVCAEIGSSGRNPQCPDPPSRLTELDDNLQQRLLEVCNLAAKARAPNPARLLAALPAASAELGNGAARALLGAVEVASHDSELADAIEMLPALCRPIEGPAIETIFAFLSDVAGGFAAGTVSYLRSMDRAWEQGGPEGFRLWVEHGIRIGQANRDAGIAHFRLESRTAHKLLVQHSTAVALSEVEQVLTRYLMMMSRRPLRLVGGQGTWFRPPLTPAQDAIVRVPERVDMCATAEENQLLYKLTVAHAAGRWEYGSYSFQLSHYQELGHPLPGDPPQAQDIVAFLDAFPNPLLASVLFTMLDGTRIDAALTREFAGLGPELERLGRFYAEHPPPEAPERSGERLIETVFLCSLAKLQEHELPARLRPYSATVAAMLARLTRPEADVYDSAALLVNCYATLELAALRGVDEDDPAVLLDLGGATVIDPLEDYGESEQGQPFTATSASSPAPPIDVDGEVADHDITLELEAAIDDSTGVGIPLTPDEIRRLIEQGVDLHISEGHGDVGASLGLYITDLLGKLPNEEIERLRELASAGDASSVRAWLATQRGKNFYYYDEWDHRIGDYRHRWCRLSENDINSDGGRYYNRLLSRCGELLQNVRREFMMMKPEQFRKVRGMEDGDDFDLAALVDAHADRKQRKTPSERLYIARRREERDVATLFLVDMSASTDEPLEGSSDDEPRRVIDVTKDTLAILAAVLDEIGDAYAIYGFSGHGRDNVEYYPIKAFTEGLGPEVRGRLGGIEPKRSTRMGAALRHSATKLATVSARARHIILLSDGFPQDFDYGDDRRSNVHGIRDTMVALQEIENQGIRTFCITVDPGGHDYLGEMCPRSRYAVIDDIEMLPEELPRIYRSVTRS